MYKFKNKLIKAQGGGDVGRKKYDMPDESYKYLFRQNQPIQQPPSSSTYSGNKFIDVNDVVDETKRRINTLRDKWNQRTEERRAPYQEQYDEIEDKRNSIKDLRSELNKIKKENRLSDKTSNLTVKEERLKNRLENRKLLDEQRDEQRNIQSEYDIDTQYENQDRRYDKIYNRKERSNARKNRLNEERYTKASTSNVNSQLNQALKTGRKLTSEELKELQNIEDIEKRANERQYKILQDHKKKDKKLEGKRISPLSVLPDGTSVNRTYFNYFPPEELYEVKGIYGDYPKDDENKEDDETLIELNKGVENSLKLTPEEIEQIQKTANKKSSPILKFNSDNVQDKVSLDTPYDPLPETEWKVDSAFEKWTNTIPIPEHKNTGYSFGEDLPVFTSYSINGKKVFNALSNPNLNRMNAEFQDINNTRPYSYYEDDLRFSINPNINRNTPNDNRRIIYAQDDGSWKQDGGYIDESDFDYTEDVDLDDLNEYLRGGYLSKAQSGAQIPTEEELKKKGWLTNDSKQRTPNAFDFADKFWIEDGNMYDYNLSGDNSLSKNQQQIQPQVDTEGKANIFDTPYWTQFQGDPMVLNTDGSPKIKKTGTESASSSDYNPYKVYEPGNKVQLLGNMIPIAYNAGRYLQPLRDEQIFYDPRKLKKAYVTPDYTAVNEASNATANALRDNSRSAQGYLASRIASEMALAKQKNQIAAQATRENVQHEQNYLNQVNQEKSVLDNLKQQWDQRKKANELAREEIGKGLYEGVEKYAINKGKVLNQERSDRIKKDTYLNSLTSDYQVEELPNGLYRIKHSGKFSPAMSFDKLQETIEGEKENKRLAAEQKTNDAISQTQKQIEELRQRNEELQKKLSGTSNSESTKTTEPKKFGGWIKETNKPVKKRNRLYL